MRYYTFADATIASRTAAGLTWLTGDHQGTTSIAVNETTQQAAIRRQAPFGTPRGTIPGSWPNSRGFVGGTIDNTGLVHLSAREYDPLTGRFISVDPVQDLNDPQQWNGYTYSNGNCALDSENKLTGLCEGSSKNGCVTHAPDPDSPPCQAGLVVTVTRAPACSTGRQEVVSREHQCFFVDR